jgi:hypothetical protein
VDQIQPAFLRKKDGPLKIESYVTPLTAAALSVFAQIIFQITISLLNGGSYFVIKIRGEFCHSVNGTAMFEDFFKEFCFCLRASRKSALRPKILTANSLVHPIIPLSYYKDNYDFPGFKGNIGYCYLISFL